MHPNLNVPSLLAIKFDCFLHIFNVGTAFLFFSQTKKNECLHTFLFPEFPKMVISSCSSELYLIVSFRPRHTLSFSLFFRKKKFTFKRISIFQFVVIGFVKQEFFVDQTI